ncbi:MAG: NAD-dependent epimerase/dehydratase family protein [Chitinophagaceae bacterium]|nr:NAD-dependent epimerase/dehydratase family protein [Chitinophagaceae bacterium]
MWSCGGPRGVYDEAKHIWNPSRWRITIFSGGGHANCKNFQYLYLPIEKFNRMQSAAGIYWSSLRSQNLTVFGDGSQTRSFCYVDDLIEEFT